jgi:membrane-associated phospholipid phosphatase
MSDATTPRPRNRLFRFFAARLDRKSYLGFHLTVGLLVFVAGVWLFGGLLEEVLDNATLVHWDLAASSHVHAAVSPAGIRIFRGITNIGSPVAMGLIALVGVTITFLRGHRLLAYSWAAAVIGGAMVDYVLKTAIHRSRPEYAAAFLHGTSYSFPSGHAMGSIIGYGCLAYALVLTLKVAGWHRRLVFVLAALMTLVVGLSRIYLGVHYPSDVVSGWAAGLAWLAVCLTGYEVVSGRAALRHPPTPSPETP